MPPTWVVCTEELEGILSGGYGAQCKVEYKFKDTKNYNYYTKNYKNINSDDTTLSNIIKVHSVYY